MFNSKKSLKIKLILLQCPTTAAIISMIMHLNEYLKHRSLNVVGWVVL